MLRRAGFAVLLAVLATAPRLADDIRLFQLTNIRIYAIALLVTLHFAPHGIAGLLARLARARVPEFRL